MIGPRPGRRALVCEIAVAATLLAGAGSRMVRVDDWDTHKAGPLDLSAVWRRYPPSPGPLRLRHPPMIVLDGGHQTLQLETDAESVRIGRSLTVDVTDLSMLVWEWKALLLPEGGDVRHPGRNDQAARVMLMFEGMKSMLYIWDTSAPVGEEVRSDELEPFPRVLIVVRSGPDGIGVWHRERRDVDMDYRRLFAEPPRRIKWVGFESHSDDVKGRTSIRVGRVAFEARASKPPR